MEMPSRLIVRLPLPPDFDPLKRTWRSSASDALMVETQFAGTITCVTFAELVEPATVRLLQLFESEPSLSRRET